MTVAARHDHPRAKAQSMHELMDDDWILNFAPGEQGMLLDNLFGQHGYQPPLHHVHLAHSASLMITLMQRTDMLTFCPWPLLETDDLRHSLAAIPLKQQFHPHTVGILRRRHETPSPASQRFIELFLTQVQAWVLSDDPQLRRVWHSVDLFDAPEWISY